MTPDDPSSLLPPTAIGPFRVLHQVGVGVLGPVYRAHDPNRDTLVAIKVFKLDLVPEQAERFVRALAERTSRLPSHPGLVPVFSTGVEQGTPWMAEAFVPWDSVDARLRRRAVVTLPEVLPLLVQISAAIDVAAAAGVCHGALHPRDVLVSTTGEVAVTGFGVALALADVGIRRPARRPYAPPERLAQGPFDARADVFALAAIVFELLTGRRLPGDGAASVQQLTALGLGVDVDACRRALAAALDGEVTRRLASAVTLAEALTQAAGESWLPPAPPTPPPVASTAASLDARVDAAGKATPPASPALSLPDDVHLDPDDQPWFPSVDRADTESGPHATVDHRDAASRFDADVGGPAAPLADAAPEDAAGDDEAWRAAPADVAAIAPDHEGPDVSPPRFDWREPEPPRAPRALAARVPLWAIVAAGLALVGLALYWWGSRPTETVVPPAEVVTPTPPPDLVVDEAPVLPEAPRETAPSTPAAPSPAARPPARQATPTPSKTPATPAVTTGSLDVVSRPAGARVFIDGRFVGETPLSLSTVQAGRRTIRLELAGYGPWTDTLILAPGGQRRVAASLDRIRQP